MLKTKLLKMGLSVFVFTFLTICVFGEGKEKDQIFCSWKEAMSKDGKVTIFGYLSGPTNYLKVNPATGDRAKGPMKSQIKGEQLHGIIFEMQKSGGPIPVLATGIIKKTGENNPRRPGNIQTGLYRGPFYTFEVEKTEILSRRRTKELADSMIPNNDIREDFLSKVLPISVGKFNVFINMLSVHVSNPRDPVFSAGVALSVKVHNNSDKKQIFETPKVKVFMGDEKVTTNPRNVKRGYHFGSAKVDAGKTRSVRWSYSLDGDPNKFETAEVKIIFKDEDGKEVTCKRSVKIAKYK
jgi:hypothetical protein